MATPDGEHLHDLREEVERLKRGNADLEARIRALEARVPFSSPPPIPVFARPELPPALPPLPLPPPIPVPPPAEAPALETQLGLNWVNRIAVFTLLLGAAFLFKYGVDNDWIGPGTRVLLGIAAAIIALVTGDRMFRKGHKVYSQGILGLGIALLYLSFWAAASFYELIPHALAFALMAATTVGAGWLALHYESQAIAILGALGGYLTPPALSTGEDHPWILLGYVFLLNGGALLMARLRLWRALEFLSLGATAILYASWASEYYNTPNRPVATLFAFAFYAEFLVARAWGVWAVAQALTSFAVGMMWDIRAQFLPYELILAAAGLGVAEVRQWRLAPSWTLVWFWIPFGFWQSQALPSDDRGMVFGWLTVAFLLFFAWLPWWSLMRERAARSGELTTAAGNALAYFAASYWLLNPVRHEYMGLLAVGIGGLHLALAKSLWKPANRAALGITGIALTFVTLAVPIQFTGFRVTIAWALEGALLTWIAARFRSRGLTAASIGVLALAFLRLYGLDAWIYNSTSSYALIANARFLTFAVSAGAFWLAARFTTIKESAAAAYIAGHLTLLVGLGMELSGYVDRSVAEASSHGVLTVGISILMALYAVALVTLGALTRTAMNRILGLGLMAIVVAKLYLVDVWELGRIFRITAFLGLGALLLAVSYLYSRFRPVIEKLWRSPPPASDS